LELLFETAFARVETVGMKECEYFPVGPTLLFHLSKLVSVGVEGGDGLEGGGGGGERHFWGQVRGHVINVGEREVDDDEEYRGAESSGK
jgi:hypothetical protein